MIGYVNGIDWINAEAMKYWSWTAATPAEKRRTETRNLIFSGDYYGALKVDGYYERLIKDEDGNCFMVARSKNVKGEATEKLAWVPQIHDFMAALPNGTVFLSECYLPGNEGSQKITSLLGCLQERCIARQAAGQKLHFYIFDVMCYGGQDMTKEPFERRIELLDDCLHKYVSDFEYIQWAIYHNGEELWDCLQGALAEGREGMVIMRKDAPVYFKRTPARVSLKIKKELKESIDCFFTGRAAAPTKDYHGKELESWQYWVDSMTDERLPLGNHYFDAFMNGKPYIPVTKPYYNKWAGSLEIAVMRDGEEYPIGYLSGLPDEVKQNYKEYRHHVVEVGAMQLTEDGRLRHGKVLSFRTPDDKIWSDCTYDQIKNL